MADLTIGVSKKALDFVVNKLENARKEEEEQWLTVQRDLVFITGEFEMMQAFLNSADGEHILNHMMRTWVWQVRDLSYDTEDCIDFVVNLDSKRSWWSWLPRLLPACSQPRATLDLDEAVSKIKQLKAQVVDVSQRNTRYNLIGDSGTKPIAHVQPSGRRLDILTKLRDAVKEGGFSDLKELIIRDDNNLCVLSVWGKGDDLWTTGIAKWVYEEPKICQSFSFRAWVKVVHPFNPRDFIQGLVAQFLGNTCQQGLDVLERIEATQGPDLINNCVGQVNEQPYLVVLEGLASMAEWQAIRMYMPDNQKGSRIIVLTQQLEIASSCIGHPYQVLELKQYSVSVFFNEGLQGGRRPSSSWQETSYGVDKEDCFPVHEFERSQLLGLIKYTVLSNEKPPVMISVWGMAGVGKSAVVKGTYDYFSNEGKSYFDVQAWVDVSYPFNLTSFCSSVVSCIRSGSIADPINECQQLSDHSGSIADPINECQQLPDRSGSIADPINECKQLLVGSKFLLVIDGLHNKEDWDLIYMNLMTSEPPRGWIVVVTREESVARRVNPDVLSIPPLQDDAALGLFKKVLGLEAGSEMNEEIIQEAKLLLAKCGGIPGDVIALAKNVAYWATRQRDTHGRWSPFVHMRSTYHACPPVLKKCIFYLSIFSYRNCIIRRSRLVRRWIAEGYSKGTSSSSLVNDVENLVDKLADMDCVLSPETAATDACGGISRVTSFQFNSLFLDYIISQEMEESIFLPLEVAALEDRCSPGMGRVGQHLAIRSSWEADKIVYDSLDSSRLRSLTVSCEWRSFFISGKMRVLRVLDLEGTSGMKDGDLVQLVPLLPRLKFLSLRGCSEIFHLPDSLGNLRQLQTLDISDTSVVMLPAGITKLQKLQYLRAGSSTSLMDVASGMADEEPSVPPSWRSRLRTMVSRWSKPHGQGPVSARNGVTVPRGFGALTALHTLGAVKLNNSAGGEAMLDELHCFEQLKKLRVSGVNRTNCRRMLQALPDHLESLSAQGDFHSHIRFPRYLNKLSLETEMLNQELIVVIGGLENLRVLSLCFMGILPGSDLISLGGFNRLKVLKIAGNSDFEFQAEIPIGALDRLELLKIHCPNLSWFSGLFYLPSLKQAWVKGPSQDRLVECLRSQFSILPSGRCPDLKLE